MWLSRLKIQHCHCCGSACCYGTGLLLSLELPHVGTTKKKRKTAICRKRNAKGIKRAHEKNLNVTLKNIYLTQECAVMEEWGWERYYIENK